MSRPLPILTTHPESKTTCLSCKVSLNSMTRLTPLPARLVFNSDSFRSCSAPCCGHLPVNSLIDARAGHSLKIIKLHEYFEDSGKDDLPHTEFAETEKVYNLKGKVEFVMEYNR